MGLTEKVPGNILMAPLQPARKLGSTAFGLIARVSGNILPPVVDEHMDKSEQLGDTVIDKTLELANTTDPSARELTTAKVLDLYRTREMAQRRLEIDGPKTEPDDQQIANDYVKNTVQIMTVVGGIPPDTARELVNSSWQRMLVDVPPLPPHR